MTPRTEEETTGATVFKDRSVLEFDWVPPRLVHRDRELAQLEQLFKGVPEGQTAQRALITGPVGTGKTALAKVFSRRLQEASRNKIEPVWVNCRKNAAEGLVLLKLLNHFDPNYPARGYSTHEMIRDLRKFIDRRDCHLVVLLDEADALARKENELIYALTRFDDERPIRKPTLSLLLVSARDDLHDMLDEATRSTVKRSNVVKLTRYNAEQLVDILNERVPLAFRKGAVEPEVVELVADIAGEDGDARYAIELLEGAGRAADEEESGVVEAEHIRAVKAHTRSVVSEAKLGLLAPHLQFVLLAVARKLKRSRRSFLTTGEAESAYALVVEEYGQEARAHTQFWKYLKELETADWVHLKKTVAGTGGQTQQISLEDLPAKILVEKLEGLIKDAAKGRKA